MRRLVLVVLAAIASAAQARDTLGVWNDWGVFRDAGVPRCYAIAMAVRGNDRGRETQGYVTVATWPRRGVHGEVHVRLSRQSAPNTPVTLSLDSTRFALLPGGTDAWATDRRMDAAIIAAMRSGTTMTISARGRDGRGFHDSYRLAGAASAFDAASLGCASQ